MKSGVSYMGHHNPKFLEIDLLEMKRLMLDDVLLAAQENDFVHMTGKLEFAPRIAEDYGIRPVVIFWGALNLFGGGRSSQFLLENPTGFQVGRDGSHRAAGCYVNPLCVSRIKEMVDIIVERGFRGYFVDEPTPLRECYCDSCRRRYDQWYSGSLTDAPPGQLETFRQRCVVDYVREISEYCKETHPDLETMCCLMPHDSEMWRQVSDIAALDNLGTDIYWINNDRDVREMVPIVGEMRELCGRSGKVHHQWLQCWNVKRGREGRIEDQGRILIQGKPDSLYVWAWEGQIGTTETCEDPEAAWRVACDVLRTAKEA